MLNMNIVLTLAAALGACSISLAALAADSETPTTIPVRVDVHNAVAKGVIVTTTAAGHATVDGERATIAKGTTTVETIAARYGALSWRADELEHRRVAANLKRNSRDQYDLAYSETVARIHRYRA